jgi:hypothetical protein
MLKYSLIPLRNAVVAAFLTMALPGVAQAAPTLKYTLAMPAPQTHYFEVSMDLGGFAADYTDVKMPVWAPGSYLVREFARNVEGLTARSADGKALAVEKITKTPGGCATPSRPISASATACMPSS